MKHSATQYSSSSAHLPGPRTSFWSPDREQPSECHQHRGFYFSYLHFPGIKAVLDWHITWNNTHFSYVSCYPGALCNVTYNIPLPCVQVQHVSTSHVTPVCPWPGVHGPHRPDAAVGWGHRVPGKLRAAILPGWQEGAAPQPSHTRGGCRRADSALHSNCLCREQERPVRNVRVDKSVCTDTRTHRITLSRGATSPQSSGGSSPCSY